MMNHKSGSLRGSGNMSQKGPNDLKLEDYEDPIWEDSPKNSGTLEIRDFKEKPKETMGPTLVVVKKKDFGTVYTMSRHCSEQVNASIKLSHRNS